MKLGRNDPCHCGSGRKYKKCCMEKDEEAGRIRQQESALAYDEDEFDDEDDDVLDSETAAENDATDLQTEDDALSATSRRQLLTDDDDDEVDEPEVDTAAATQRWKEFEKQNYEGQIALFLQTLEEMTLMDSEMAFGMLDKLRSQTTAHNERDRYDALIEQLRERLPKVYARHAHFYLENCIDNAVLAGRFERVPPLLNELAQRADHDIDSFNDAVDQLAYHGQLATLLDAIQIAWPLIEDSVEIVPWGIAEVSSQAAQFLIFDYLERHGADTAGWPELFERLKTYAKFEAEQVNRFMALLTGQAGRQWAKDDFNFKPQVRRRDDREAIRLPKNVQQNLFELSLDFQGYLRREENMPWTKSELGRLQLIKYLVERLNGELEPRLSMLESAMNRPKPKTRSPRFYMTGDENAVNWLCPDRETLDHFLSGMFHFINHQPYTATATFEIIPAWLRFLEAHQLLSAPLCEKTRLDLGKLNTDLSQLLKNLNSDPALLAAMEGCR